MKVRTPSGQVYRIRRRWGLWRWRSVDVRMPDQYGLYTVRGSANQNVAGFLLVAALVQAILLPLLLPIAIASRTIFGRPWFVHVSWARTATEIHAGSWSESGALIESLARHIEETGSLIGTAVFPD